MAGVRGQRSGGHNAKTRDQLNQEGTFRPDRHGGLENPRPPAGLPTPPRPLDPLARGEWNRMIKRLELSKTVSQVDDAALYQYCNLWAETETIRADNRRIQELAKTLKVTAIKELQGPDLVKCIAEIVKLEAITAKYRAQLRQGHAAIRQYLVEFGMTPAARGRVKTTSPATPAPIHAAPKSQLEALQDAARAIRIVPPNR